MHVDWVARERPQEAARAGEDAVAGPEGYLSRGAIRRVTLAFFALRSSLGIPQGSDRVLYA
jgi:hypothetical protein